MTKETALRIFGLDASASHAAARAAHASLRGHLESRAHTAESLRHERAAAFYREQLHDLDHALAAIVGSGAARVAGRGNRSRGFWIGLALVALLALVWLARGIAGGRGGDPGGEAAVQPSGLARSDGGAGARLGVLGNLAGAVAQIVDLESGETRYRGPADGRLHELPVGEYAVWVEREGCPDAWRDRVVLEPGSHVERLARNCTAHGLLSLRETGEQARVAIDGNPVEAADEIAVPSGRRRVRVERAGFEPWEATLDIAAGSQVALEPRLAARAPEPVSAPAPAQRAKPPAKTAAGDAAPSVPREEWLTHQWHRTARSYLLARYDRDRSGKLDSLDEIEAIPCSDWRGLEQSFDEGGLALSMTRFYGFDGTKWVEDAFGVSGAVRGDTYLRLKDCGLR